MLRRLIGGVVDYYLHSMFYGFRTPNKYIVIVLRVLPNCSIPVPVMNREGYLRDLR
jgi:hypothetical protein